MAGRSTALERMSWTVAHAYRRGRIHAIEQAGPAPERLGLLAARGAESPATLGPGLDQGSQGAWIGDVGLLLSPDVFPTHGARFYGADGRAVLLLGLALAGSTLAARGGLALLTHIRGHALSRHAGRVEWGLLTVGALAASLASALLAWHIAGARGGWRPAVSWLAALAAIHLLAALSALTRRGGSTVPAWVGLVGCGLLLAYIALASAGRIAGA